MKSYIGVTGSTNLDRLKQYALFFDQTAVVGLDCLLEIPDLSSEFNLDWLKKGAIIFDPDELSIEDAESYLSHFYKSLEKDSILASHSEIMERQKDIKALAKTIMGDSSRFEHSEKMPMEVIKNIKDRVDKLLEIVSVDINRFTRAEACLLRKSGYNAFPILAIEDSSGPAVNISRAQTIGLVLNKIPIPESTTSWEKIKEYRDDPDSKGQLSGLRNWITETAKLKLTPSETEDKLDWLLYEYERHIKLHKMKFNTGILETCITLSAEVAENLFKLKFADIARKLFSLKYRELNLFEEEAKAPGKEIAYLIRTKDRFSNKRV